MINVYINGDHNELSVNKGKNIHHFIHTNHILDVPFWLTVVL